MVVQYSNIMVNGVQLTKMSNFRSRRTSCVFDFVHFYGAYMQNKSEENSLMFHSASVLIENICGMVRVQSFGSMPRL